MLSKCWTFSVRPLSVELGATVANVPLFSGHNQSFTCLAFGSFPAPSVSWWIDDRFQIDTHQEVKSNFSGFRKPSPQKIVGKAVLRFEPRPRKCKYESQSCMKLQVTEDNRTLSTLFLHASREMHGGKLSCQVENPMVPNSRIEDSRTLQIHCKNTKFSTNSTLTNCFGHCHRPWVCFLSLCSHYQRASEQRKCVNAKLQSIYNVNFLRKVYSLHFTTTQNDIPIYAQVPTSFLWKKILTKIKLEFFSSK